MVETRTPQGMAGRLRGRMERPGMRLPATHHRKPTTSDGTTALTYCKLTDDFAKRLDEAIEAFKTKLTEPEATK